MREGADCHHSQPTTFRLVHQADILQMQRHQCHLPCSCSRNLYTKPSNGQSIAIVSKSKTLTVMGCGGVACTALLSLSASPLSVPGPCRNLQFLPSTASLLYCVRDRNMEDTWQIGMSGCEGSASTKGCRRRNKGPMSEEGSEGVTPRICTACSGAVPANYGETSQAIVKQLAGLNMRERPS